MSPLPSKLSDLPAQAGAKEEKPPTIAKRNVRSCFKACGLEVSVGSGNILYGRISMICRAYSKTRKVGALVESKKINKTYRH